MGSYPIARIYHKDTLIYPNPVKDKLLLWYDTMGGSNSILGRGILEDLSGNGNDGILSGFSYGKGSGYQSEKELNEINLYKDSGYPYSGLYAYTPTKMTVDGVRCLRFSNENNILALNTMDNALTIGKVYTMSFDAKASTPMSLGRVYLNPNNTNFMTGQMVTTEWDRYSFTFTVKTNGSAFKTHMYPTFNSGSGELECIYLANWKIEEGDTATDWSPAPEDKSYEDFGHHIRNLSFDGVKDEISTSKLSEDLSLNYSLEICMTIPDIDKLTHTEIFIGSSSWDTSATSGVAIGYSLTHKRLIFVDRGAWSSGIIIERVDTPIGKPFVIHAVSDVSGSSLYINGAKLYSKTYTRGSKVISQMGIGRGVSYGRHANFNLHSAKVYNKPLTESEVQINYRIEKERWNL